MGSVCLPRVDSRLGDDDRLVAMGWGKTSDASPVSSVLMEAVLTTIADRQCRRFYTRANLHQNIVCTKDPKYAAVFSFMKKECKFLKIGHFKQGSFSMSG